jgi:hypothetical protein
LDKPKFLELQYTADLYCQKLPIYSLTTDNGKEITINIEEVYVQQAPTNIPTQLMPAQPVPMPANIPTKIKYRDMEYNSIVNENNIYELSRSIGLLIYYPTNIYKIPNTEKGTQTKNIHIIFENLRYYNAEKDYEIIPDYKNYIFTQEWRSHILTVLLNMQSNLKTLYYDKTLYAKKKIETPDIINWILDKVAIETKKWSDQFVYYCDFNLEFIFYQCATKSSASKIFFGNVNKLLYIADKNPITFETFWKYHALFNDPYFAYMMIQTMHKYQTVTKDNDPKTFKYIHKLFNRIYKSGVVYNIAENIMVIIDANFVNFISRIADPLFRSMLEYTHKPTTQLYALILKQVTTYNKQLIEYFEGLRKEKKKMVPIEKINKYEKLYDLLNAMLYVNLEPKKYHKIVRPSLKSLVTTQTY